ncbi:hypothetical protein TR80_014395 [Xanthomonas campestris]|nr:hypothetical protein TR80_014395 [Xanthomonas campestris]
MSLTKISAWLAYPERAARRGARTGVCFFGYFLCTSNESNSTPAGGRKLCTCLEVLCLLQANKSTAFTPYGRESLFFACAKKSNQKKAHPVLAPSALRAPGPHAIREFFKGTSLSL